MLTMCERDHMHDDAAAADACNRLPGAPAGLRYSAYRYGRPESGPAPAPVLAIFVAIAALVLVLIGALMQAWPDTPAARPLAPGFTSMPVAVPTTYGPPGPNGGPR